jgi:6-phosphogluconolactonase
MNVRWQSYADAGAAAEACAHRILGLLEEALARQELATLAVSGGSTPKKMFQIMAAAKFKWDRVHLFWVDERCVPPTDPASNFKLTDDNLIQPAHIPSRQVHRILGEGQPEQAAEKYSEEIRHFFGLSAGEMPHFDVVHRGMGPDGHTASLFPGDPLTEDRERIAGSTFAPQFQQWRVTLLSGALAAAKQTVMLVAGADKKETLRAVFEEEYNPRKYPAQIGMQQGRMQWFVDQGAAALLS